MPKPNISLTTQAINYIEANLNSRLDLTTIANALHYSKFYLHRTFNQTLGLTLHSYAQRRQLTEAARLLVNSTLPIIEIALNSGYASQQAFSDIFKAMYKISPAEFRAKEFFYPLQLPAQLKTAITPIKFKLSDIKPAQTADIPAWLDLVNLTVDGYPCLKKTEYLTKLQQYINSQQALVLQIGQTAIGAMTFSVATDSIDFLAIHPQYRNLGLTQLFIAKLSQELQPGHALSLTTYRAGDKADTGWRNEYRRLGFQEAELLVEFGYPTQRFKLPAQTKEAMAYAANHA